MPTDLFRGEEGYTSVAVATALLASVALVLCMASAEWTMARSADIQDVADAAALAGAGVVSRYCTIAKVVDACVLSMGLAGMTIMGAALVMAAIPGAQTTSADLLDAGKNVLDARDHFAKSVSRGLEGLESLLPGAVMAQSLACVRSNCEGELTYYGVAIPFPARSLSDFGSWDDQIDCSEMEEATERLQEASQEASDAKKRADEALERAWRADCVDDPRCMLSRAYDLAGLSAAQNPSAPTAESWTFGMAIRRSRAYYATRLENETPEAQDIESRTDSAARSAFYQYALQEVREAWYREGPDGEVDLYLPHLARTSDEVRTTQLYTDPVWPCTQEELGRTLHSVADCPGANGAPSGADCLASLEAGMVRRCEECAMDVADLGAVASISTIATNGYEHYWQIVVEESQRYAQARNEQAEAERRLQGAAEQGESVFQKALEQLRAPRPHICPPGAWGCVSVVRRSEGAATPAELTGAFAGGTTLPAGLAVSAAALAPDDSSDVGETFARLVESAGGGGVVQGALGGTARLWGRIVCAYGSAYDAAAGEAGSFLDGLDGVFGGTAGSWLKERAKGAIENLGLAPADMRMLKPVLTNTKDVLGRAGMDPHAELRTIVEGLAEGGTNMQVPAQPYPSSHTIAELPIPGTGMSVPLVVDLGTSGGEP